MFIPLGLVFIISRSVCERNQRVDMDLNSEILTSSPLLTVRESWKESKCLTEEAW